MWFSVVSGIVVGGWIGWFSYRHEAWFIDICVGMGAMLSMAAIHMARPVAFSMPTIMEIRTRMAEVPPEGLADAPIWHRVALAIPGEVLMLSLCGFMTAFAVRLACHVKARCYTDPPPVLTREALRAKLWAEMNYSDELLD